MTSRSVPATDEGRDTKAHRTRSPMYHIPLIRLMIVRDSQVPVPRKTVHAPADAASIAAKYLEGQDREHFIVLLLDTKHHVNAIHTVAIGTLNETLVHPREVFKAALLANAAAMIVAHNHPSGDVSPSQEDLALTQRLRQAGDLLGVPVLDHLIIGEAGVYCSLKERGLM